MKRKIGLALASGLALLVAGCASQTSSGSSTGGGPAEAAPVTSVGRNASLSVKCPGVHWEKTHGWSDDRIMQQEAVSQQDIPACEQWFAAQPKGYVPPPPSGAAPVAAKGPSTGGAPAPAQQ